MLKMYKLNQHYLPNYTKKIIFFVPMHFLQFIVNDNIFL